MHFFQKNSTQNTSKPRIVIIGGGFGGVYTAQRLAHSGAHITLISRTNYFLFTPLLHEVATGGLAPTTVVESLHELFRKTDVHVCVGEVTSIATDSKEVRTEQGYAFPYDYAVLASGARSSDFGVAGVEQYAYALKTLPNAIAIRSAVLAAFDNAMLASSKSERTRALSFVVVGGGATGTETVAEIAEFAQGTLCAYFAKKSAITPADISVTLISSAPTVLEQFPEHIRVCAEEVLSDKGVDIICGERVARVEKHAVVLGSERVIDSAVTIWAAGVQAEPIPFTGNAPALQSGRLIVNRYLQVPHVADVYALGDAAAFVPENTDGTPVPMLAQVAVEEAKVVAANIIARMRGSHTLEPYQYKLKGMLISLGQWSAAGEISGVAMRGRITWWIWRTIYLFKFFSFRKRLRVALEWTINLFYPRDTTEIG